MLHDWQTQFAAELRAMPGEPQAMPVFLGEQSHRFSVYRDNMLGSLVEALGDTFPVARQLVGERFFDSVAGRFVRGEPPSAPRLSRYGATFPAYLRTVPQLSNLSYVADVASLEWARVEAYFAGAAAEILVVEALLAQPADILPYLTFKTVPSLHVVAAPTAIHRIWIAHQSTAPDLAGLDPWQAEAVRLICLRQGVTAEPITLAHASFLQALQAGATLTSAAEMALSLDDAFNLQASLARELEVGSFSGIALPTAADIEP
jgi:hypothetical protein